MGQKKKSVKKTGISLGKIRHILLGLSVGVVLALCMVLILFGAGNIYFADRIFLGVKIGEMDFSGTTRAQAVAKLALKADEFKNKKIIIKAEDGRSWTLAPDEIGFAPNVDETAQNLYLLGRGKIFFVNLSQIFQLLFRFIDNRVVGAVNQGQLEEYVGKIVGEVNSPEQDATLVIEDKEIVVVKEKSGVRADKDKAVLDISRRVSRLEDEIVYLEVRTVEPKVYEEAAVDIKEKVGSILAANIRLTFKDQVFDLDRDKIAKWLDFSASNRKVPQGRGYYLEFNLSPTKLQAYIRALALALDKEAVDAKLKIENGKAVVFQPSVDGIRVEQDKLFVQIKVAIEQGGEQNITIPNVVTAPEVSSAKINDLGINELIGEATTSFIKSPENRVHNIKTGASFLNGLLIKSGDTFSTIAALGKIDGSTGYLPELVIKENKTQPEFGGGLCQVSTTLFRAALNAGLPIAERQNHSWRISYYEPPVGLDATIYLPKPDLKIKNDTPGWILIQSSVDTEAKKITFQFYGTKDGRTAKIIGPKLLYSTPPGETVYVDEPSLPSGELKKLENAHPGGSATATYQVFDKNGKLVNEQVFNSKYKAVPAKYLRGTAPPAASALP